MDEDELSEQDFDSFEELIGKLQSDANKARTTKTQHDKTVENKQKNFSKYESKKNTRFEEKNQNKKNEEKEEKKQDYDYIEVKDYEEPQENIQNNKSYKKLKLKLLLVAMGVIAAIDGYWFSKNTNKETYPKEKIKQAEEQIEYCDECGYEFENLSDDEIIEGIISISELANVCPQNVYESYESADSYKYFSDALSLAYLENIYEEENLSEEKIEDYNNLAYGAIFVYDENEDNRLLNDEAKEYVYVMQESIDENIEIKEKEEQAAEEEARQAELLKKQVQNVISNIESKFDYEFSFLSEEEIIDRVTKLSEWLNNQTQESFENYFFTYYESGTVYDEEKIMHQAFNTTSVLDNYYKSEDGKRVRNYQESSIIVGTMILYEDIINSNELLNDNTKEWLLNVNKEVSDINLNHEVGIRNRIEYLNKEKQNIQGEENTKILDDGEER